ncbi:protein of unknown function [Candidatus Nitrosocosmicus franklandus]|uniref:Uncharacterized protein n=1 Tax=Candidatus Nitrosocosmicus franklandianus TaxID=1798806 RepID=A0A484IAW2_9ARCH|nr:protein of unknown function [Candidatus Nitrosocosmicus franklandus]
MFWILRLKHDTSNWIHEDFMIQAKGWAYFDVVLGWLEMTVVIPTTLSIRHSCL